MKKLSTYLFLILFSFSAPSFADDISEFEIEGISIGDSMLDFFSEEEIKNNIKLDYFSPIQNKTFNMSRDKRDRILKALQKGQPKGRG